MIKELIDARYGLPLSGHIPTQDTTTGSEGHLSQPLADNETLRTILQHASARKFEPEAVPEPLMQQLFATAFSAPSKSDLQQVSVIRMIDPSQRNRIVRDNPKIAWTKHAPQFMIWCADNRRIRQICETKKYPFANDHLDSFMNSAVDTGIAMQTFIIAADSVGLRCCPISEVRNSIEYLSKELDLPPHVFPVAGLCVGWPLEEPSISMRLPLDITVHTNQYNDDSLSSKVKSYDLRRESTDQTPTEKQRQPERFGLAEVYGWSEDHARQYSEPLRADFGRYIRKQGFDLS
ncbi:MAG: NADPH-dependent oxidoreductase [Gammaproteobacteria bacterium]|nr:NADPH-dependent oxidoreductase [Gammaproteobacteria bacterium]